MSTIKADLMFLHSSIFFFAFVFQLSSAVDTVNTSYRILMSWSRPWYSVGCSCDWLPGGRGFDLRRVWQHNFMQNDLEMFSTVIISLPLSFLRKNVHDLKRVHLFTLTKPLNSKPSNQFSLAFSLIIFLFFRRVWFHLIQHLSQC